jgi:hypothetical protein
MVFTVRKRAGRAGEALASRRHFAAREIIASPARLR